MNTGLLFSPVAISTIPNVTPGGGIIWIPSEENEIKLLAIGTAETAGHDPFERYEGTTFLGEWATKFKIADRPSGMTFSGSYSIDEERPRITDDPRLLLADYVAGVPLVSIEDSWSIMWNGYHYLSGDESEGWGLFGRFGVSDGDPNPVHWAGAAGIGGIQPPRGTRTGPLGSRTLPPALRGRRVSRRRRHQGRNRRRTLLQHRPGPGTNLTLDIQVSIRRYPHVRHRRRPRCAPRCPLLKDDTSTLRSEGTAASQAKSPFSFSISSLIMPPMRCLAR